MRNGQIKSGVILSYALMLVNTLSGLFLTPFILQHVGAQSYGVYKSVASLSASLAVIDLGLGSTTIRYMAQYHAKNELDNAGNFLAMIFVQFAVFTSIILIFGIAIFFNLSSIYGNTFSASDLSLAKTLVCFLLFNMVVQLFENLLSGVAVGYERFGVSNGIKLICLISKFLLIFILLPLTKNILLVVILESLRFTVLTVFFFYYDVKKIGVKPKLIKWDNNLFKESLGYTFLMFIQSLTVQFNSNVDNVLIGAYIGPASVTVYSIVLTIYGTYQNLSGTIANVMLPNMTKRVLSGQSPEEMQKGVEKTGRLQFIIAAAALGGFIVLGKDFFNLWLDQSFSDCYYLTLILISAATPQMVQNVALSILRAQNKMGYRTTTLAISCVLNIIITVIGIKMLGYLGAAIGTAFASVFNIVVMDIYYHKHLKFKILIMFYRIFKRILPCAAVATCVTLIAHTWFNSTWTSFFANAILFCVIYGGLLLAWGLTREEKVILLGRFGKKI